MEEDLVDPASRPSLIRRAALLQASLSQLLRAVQSLDRRRAQLYGLTVSQLHALLVIGRRGPTRVTLVAKGLLKKGLIRKRSPSSDDRKVILQTTEQGMRLLRKILNDLSEEYIQLLAAMDPAVREALPAHLSLLTRELSAKASSPDPIGTGRVADIHQSRRKE
jgi:DNA-binding MarR family transcriptional regulator